jgi:hypothetical protein
MNEYWAIADSNHADERVERFEANTDEDACRQADEWLRKDLGPGWRLMAVAKRVDA